MAHVLRSILPNKDLFHGACYVGETRQFRSSSPTTIATRWWVTIPCKHDEQMRPTTCKKTNIARIHIDPRYIYIYKYIILYPYNSYLSGHITNKNTPKAEFPPLLLLSYQVTTYFLSSSADPRPAPPPSQPWRRLVALLPRR